MLFSVNKISSKYILIYPVMIVFTVMLLAYTNVILASTTGPDLEDTRVGLELMSSGEYEAAADHFGKIISNDHIIKDFLHLWRAESLFWIGDNEQALNEVNFIKDRYSQTSAFKGASRLELEIMKYDGSIVDRYREYLSVFSSDNEIRYRLAIALRDADDKKEAEAIFKDLHIQGGELSDEAGLEFDSSVLTLDERMTRANNFLERWNFVAAEKELNKAIIIAPDEGKEEILEKIAYCKFRQKDYVRSAEIYGDLHNEYMEAISYLRTNRKRKFISSIDKLLKMKDPRAGILLIALANDKRRSGNFEDAIATLNRAIEGSPFHEDATWQIGWTYYVRGDYKKASDIFSELQERYDSDRYSYWELRSNEKLTKEVPEGYGDLCNGNGYYAFLSCLRSGTDIRKVEVGGSESSLDSPLLQRFTALKKLGFKEEALFELNRLIRSLRKPSEIVLYSKKLKEIGEYKKAISVATMVPYGDDVHNLWYPVAYWDIIKVASDRFSIDPVFILSIAREESRLDPEARSVAGAMGLMQLMPSTADRLCRKIKCVMSGQDPYFDIETNIVLGSYYLKSLLDRFKSIPVATAAYNAGENAVHRWMGLYSHLEPDEFIEEIPYPETRGYVKKVLTTLFQYSRSMESGEISDKFRRSASLGPAHSDIY
ncbi:MAG: transglycosylase SLT domain-containing protein [Nitrospirota bacterium]|nr:MAG: transglycosylase SLT domain-containing protein [Nitrospirota bacterium]